MRKIPTLQNGKQLFEHYTSEDEKVWKLLFEKQKRNIDNHFSREYCEAMSLVGMDQGQIPNFKSIDSLLSQKTGWSLYGVREIVDIDQFLDFMISRRFPATTWVRSLKELDYLEEPDMFHDVFGHVPLLANSEFAGFLEGLGKLGVEFGHSAEALKMVQRVYWFTVEFGLIHEDGLKAYGAGIISSPGEVENFLSGRSEKKDFSIAKIVNTDFRTDIFQSTYFVIESLEQLYQSLQEVRKVLEEHNSIGV